MAKTARTDYITTPEFRVSFAHIFAPHVNPKSGKPSYGVVALFPKATTNMQALSNIVSQCASLQWGDRATAFQWNNPIHDGDTAIYVSGDKKGQLKCIANPEIRGHWTIDMSSLNPVGVVDSNVQPIFEQARFYSGCYAVARVNAYAYENEQYGINVGLGALQKTRDGEPLSSGSLNAEKEFAPIPQQPGMPPAPQQYAPAPQQYAPPPAAPGVMPVNQGQVFN